jgi:excisionase family DNA binding protein
MDTNRPLTTQELADFLQVPIATIYGWRYRGEGPKASKVGRHLRYRFRDVEDWLDRMGQSTRGEAR